MKTKTTTTKPNVAPAAPKATTKATPAKRAAHTPAKAATKATQPKAPAATPAAGSKKATVIALIGRKGGATLAEIMTATCWQKHTVRGFISILGKKGTKIASTTSAAGARTYKAAAGWV